MKPLTEFITEGLLKGQQKTLASGEKDIDAVKNIPRLKDFYTNPGGIAVLWHCPGFIQNYLKYIKCIKPQSLQNVSSTVDLSKIDSVRCYCRTHGGRFTTLSIGEYGNITNSMPLECSRGKFEDTSAVKKSILRLFKMLADNPENFKKLFEMHNDVCEKEYSTDRNGYLYWDSKSKYAHQSIDDIIKQLN